MRHFPRLLALALALAAASTTTVWAQASAANVRGFAPSTPIRGQYIVVFKDHVPDARAEAATVMRGVGAQGRLLHTYTAAIKGFSAQLPDAAVQALRNNPNVLLVEEDQTVQLNQTQADATWGLDRIDQVDRPLDGQYEYNATGSGVTAFIIDTGIRADHVEFGGRVGAGFTSINDGRGTSDCDGHGTHVAGTVGGSTWGVAKQVSLVPVRVLDCRGSGTWSGVIAGVDWVANSTVRPAVANMSLGGGKSTSVNAAVAGAVAKGVTMAVAGGNSSADACNYSPASEPTAITVGATTSSDSRASYSNYGSCLDIFAPGSSITSAWHTGATATNTISGTSMASPHVCGVGALYKHAFGDASSATVHNWIINNSTTGRIKSNPTGTPNRLLFKSTL